MSQTESLPSSSSESGVVVREGSHSSVPYLPISIVRSVRAGRGITEAGATASFGTADRERDIQTQLEKQEEVMSFEINMAQKKIDVWLGEKTDSIEARIQKLFDNYTVTFYKGHLATSQHWTANMMKAEPGGYAAGGVSIYYDTPDPHPPQEQEATSPFETVGSAVREEHPRQEIWSTDSTEGSYKTASIQAKSEAGFSPISTPPSPPLDAHEPASSSQPMSVPLAADTGSTVNSLYVYVSTMAHIWQNNVPENGNVKCNGRVKLLDEIQIANCNFFRKQCRRNRMNTDTLLCTITDGDGPLRIPTVFDIANGIDVSLIPLQYDVAEAKNMIEYGTVSPVVIENIWEKTTPVYVVYGQYARQGSIALHVLKATITRVGVRQRTTLGFYNQIIQYTLETSNYKTQVGDCGSPLFTVVAGQVRLLGFHVAAFEGTAICYAVPASSNLDVFATPVGYERTIYIPATLNARLEERALC